MTGGFDTMPHPEELPAEFSGDGEAAARRAQWVLLLVTAALVMFGLTMLYSTSSMLYAPKSPSGVMGMKYFRMQLLWLTLGLGSAAAVFLAGYRRVAALWPALAGVVFLLLMAALFSKSINGAHRWLNLRLPGLGTVGIQPSEFAKVVLALMVSKYCSDHLRTFSELRRLKGGLLELMLYAGPVILGILIGRDFGTTVLTSAMVFLILLAAGLPIRWTLLPIGGLTAAFFIIMNFDPMRRARILSFLDPEKFASTIGYQLWTSFLALGAGGWCGVGFMESRMKAEYLPEAHTDFIMAIVGEELGLVTLVLVVIAYGVFCWAGLQISLHAGTRLGMLLGFGLTMYMTIQTIINLGVISGCLPTKGMPAPFISYGGSNMLSCMTAVGLLLSIAQETVTPDYSKRILAHLRRKWPFGRTAETSGE